MLNKVSQVSPDNSECKIEIANLMTVTEESRAAQPFPIG